MSPFSVLKRFVSPRPVSAFRGFDLPQPPKATGKTYDRICEIYSQSVAGRDFTFTAGDGLDSLLSAGLRRVIKEAIDLSAQTSVAYVLLHFNDVTTNLNEAVGDFTTFEMGKVTDKLPENLHPSRYLVFPYWKSEKEREALKSVCRLWDESAVHLGEGLASSLRPHLHLGDLSSLMDTRSYTTGETEELKTLLSRLSSPRAQILGKGDSLTTLNPSASVVGIFSGLAGYLSFLSGIPLSFLLPNEKEDQNAQILFQQEIMNLCELAVRPAIDELLARLGLTSQWSFQELSAESQKERAEAEHKRSQTASLWVETLLASRDLSGEGVKALQDEIANQAINFLKKH